MSVLAVESLSYAYNRGTPLEKKVLHDISYTFADGKITGLIGHTGSGKSTLVQMLNGILRPDGGRVLLNGEDIWKKPKEIASVRFKVGLVFQYPEYQLFEETVKKDISFGPRNIGLPEDEIESRVTRAAKFCGIGEELFEKSPFDISGGQKRRVAIAGVIAMAPEVLILDEPAAGLDPMGREEILGRIWSYQRETIVSHSMEDMASYCDELLVLNRGEVYTSGTCAEVFSAGEDLEQVGLSIPQVTSLLLLLKKAGLPVNADLYTVEAARSELSRYYFSQKGKGK